MHIAKSEEERQQKRGIWGGEVSCLLRDKFSEEDRRRRQLALLLYARGRRGAAVSVLVVVQQLRLLLGLLLLLLRWLMFGARCSCYTGTEPRVWSLSSLCACYYLLVFLVI